MDKRSAEIAFTPAVRAAQAHYGSRDGYAAVAAKAADFAGLGERESLFIEGLDGFYQATVGEGGWPYVQFRGGPCELAEHQHAVVVDPGGDELLGNQIHPIAQRSDQHHVGRAVERDEVLQRHGPVDVVDR